MPNRKMVMENNITYSYTIKEVELIDKDGYTDVIESVNYTITALHDDGRSASTDDSYTFDLGNLGYTTFSDFDTLNANQIASWVERMVKTTVQDMENRKYLAKEVRSQTSPNKKIVSFN